MLRPSVVDGKTRGRVPERPEPPPPLPPVELPPRGKVGSDGVPIEDVVRAMVVAYKEFVRGERCGPLLRRVDGDWRHVLRLMASDLMDEGMSGAAYVRFVCAEVKRLRERDPWPAEVFSFKSFERWLPSYRTSGAVALEVEGYTSSPARRREYSERVEACRATS